MPSKKRVVSVRFDDVEFRALSRFSAVIGKSKGAICAEVLVDMLPVLTQIAEAVELARKAENGALKGWRESVLSRLDPVQKEAEGLRESALQMLHEVFQVLEEEAQPAPSGVPDKALDGRRRRSEPPSL